MQYRVLSDQDVNRIHEATLQVLATQGIWFQDCPEALELFAQNGCSVRDECATLPSAIVADALAAAPDRGAIQPFFPGLGYAQPLSVREGESHFGLIGNAFYIYDYEQKDIRDCLETDIADKLLILDSLPNVEYDCCNLIPASERGTGKSVRPTYEALPDCTRFLRRWVRGRAVPDRKKLPLGWRNCCHEESRLTLLGHAILEGSESTARLLEEDSSFPWVNPTSPLQYKAAEAKAMIDAARNGHWNLVSPEVMMGGTAPVTMAGTLVQHNAEVLAGLVLTQLARPGSPYIYGCVSAPMDLRVAEISHGNYETALFNAAVVQMADHYGLPTRISPGNTSARRPGPRALAETAIGLYTGAAAGGSIITTGLLDSTLMMSYEHLVMVDELINQIRGITRGIETDPDSLALDAIAACGRPGGNYLASEHTLQFMNRDIYYSDFCGRTPTSYEDAYDKAHGRVNEILARRESDAHVDAEILARLGKVEFRLAHDDRTWRTAEGDWWTTYLEDLS